MNDDPRPLHRVAIDDAIEMVGRVTVKDLDRATPCGGWSLADLLAHMVGQHRGFAVAVNDHDAPAAAYEPVPFDRSNWDSSVAALLEAFDHAELEDKAVLIEVRPAPLPVRWIVAAQTLDTAVHTWDIAEALGQWYEPPAAVTAAVADLAATIPDGDGRSRPGSAFGPALPIDGSPWERALSQLGRDPRRASASHEGPQ